MPGKGLLEEQRESFRECDECDTASDGKHDGLLHVLVSVLHLEIDVEGTDQDDNGSNGLHQVRYRSLVGTDFLSALVKPAAPLLPAITFDVEIISAMAATTHFCPKLEPIKRSVRFRAFFFINCISE